MISVVEVGEQEYVSVRRYRKELLVQYLERFGVEVCFEKRSLGVIHSDLLEDSMPKLGVALCRRSVEDVAVWKIIDDDDVKDDLMKKKAVNVEIIDDNDEQALGMEVAAD